MFVTTILIYFVFPIPSLKKQNKNKADQWAVNVFYAVRNLTYQIIYHEF